MTAPQVQVEGIRRVVRELEKLGADASDMKKVFKKIGERGVVESKRQVPVRSGRLAASIRSSNRKNEAIITAGKKSVPYARPIHWGWPKRNIKANQFMYRALEPLTPWAVNELRDGLNDIITKRGF